MMMVNELLRISAIVLHPRLSNQRVREGDYMDNY